MMDSKAYQPRAADPLIVPRESFFAAAMAGVATKHSAYRPDVIADYAYQIALTAEIFYQTKALENQQKENNNV